MTCLFPFPDHSYQFDPDSESDDDNDLNVNDDDVATFSTPTSVTSPHSSMNKLRSKSTLNLSPTTSVSSTTTPMTNLIPASTDTNNSLTNRFLSMFSNATHSDGLDLTSLDSYNCLNELTPAAAAAAAAANFRSNNNRVSFFGRQLGDDATTNHKFEQLQKSKSTFCLGINSDLIEEELNCMSSSAVTNSNVARSSIPSQPLSVDTILKTSRTRKTGASIWASDQPVSDESNWMTTPKAAPRLKFSLPTTLEFVSCWTWIRGHS